MPLTGIKAHRETAQRLLAELKRRPSHAYLFSGPRGVGKALVASAIAHGLLCERSPGADFCCTVERCPIRSAPPPTPSGRRRAGAEEPRRCDCCAACVQIASGVHPDFTLIGRAANRTDVLIEQVRSLIAELGRKPTRSDLRVAIIDDAETLNVPAQNALLKTLEEPPGHAIIFMITAAERVLLDTVRSRMRPVRFGTLSVADLEAILAARGIDETRRAAAARRARGSAARALATTDTEEPAINELLDALSRVRGFDFVAAQQMAQQYFANREQAAENFELIARLLEEMLCSKLLDAEGASHVKAIADLAGAMPLNAILSCLEGAVNARDAVDTMANPRLQAEQYWMNAARAMRGE